MSKKPVSHKSAAYDAQNLEAAKLIAEEPDYPDGSARHKANQITLARLGGAAEMANAEAETGLGRDGGGT